MEHAKNQERTKVRRARAAQACSLCRAKKNKCDELYPCSYCKARNVECVYRNGDRLRVYPAEYVKKLERQVRSLTATDSVSNKSGALKMSSPGDDYLRASQQIIPAEEYTGIGSSGILPPQSDLYTPVEVGSDVHLDDITRSPIETDAPKEVTSYNWHTKNVEFYGSSSSMVLLCRIQINENNTEAAVDAGKGDGSLVSLLHNPVFTPEASDEAPGSNHSISNPVSYYPAFRCFIDAFFGSIHYIHPILDKASFLSWCDDRLFDDSESQSQSSIALYYAILSLGALVGVRDEEPIEGLTNLEWSRKFFEDARKLCNKLSMTTDLEMVQCLFFMAKVCQNELNPHLSYMYIGLAVRTALAMGINREPPADSKKSHSQLKAEARVWWGLYSLETEISFSMGRPHTLGSDLCHNRRFPQVQDAELSDGQNPNILDHPCCAMINCMVDFSRITSNVCHEIYLSCSPSHLKITLANRIEQDLIRWLENIPPTIRPEKAFVRSRSLKEIKNAQYIKKQKLVLFIRYHNVRMLLFASLLSPATKTSSSAMYHESIQKCLDSAKQTIDIIYDTYQHHDFFRTWFYNTTYTLFAVSIILVYIMQEATIQEKGPLFGYVEMAIEILETMDECVVAQKAAKVIHRALTRARESTKLSHEPQGSKAWDLPTHHTMGTFNHHWGPVNLMDEEFDVGFPLDLDDLGENQSNFDGFMVPGDSMA